MTARRRLLLPALATLPVLAVLLALGTWQAQRLVWKTALLERLAAAEAAPPIPFSAAAEPWTRVVVEGRLDPGRQALLGLEVRGTVLGARLLTPLLREGAPALLVDRGWVPVQRDRPVPVPAGPLRIEGYVRPGERAGWLAARDDVAGRHFQTADPAAIGAALGLPAVEPVLLVALSPAGAVRAPAALPDPQHALPRPTNPHLGYAITWYGLAAALVGVFAAWARRRLQEPG